jgi:hypothetical protein
MKKFLVFLLLIGCAYAQYGPVFKYKNVGGRYFDAWSDTAKTYFWHSVGDDTIIISQLFAPTNGYDGLRQFLVRIDSLGNARDGDTISIRNFSYPIAGGSSYKTTSIAIDTTAAFSIFFIVQSYLGETFGWETNDTLEWSLYGDTTRVSTTTSLTLAEEATLYTSLYRPTESDGQRDYGIWQTDVPVPWRVVGYFPHVISGDTNTVALKFEVADHVPNRR